MWSVFPLARSNSISYSMKVTGSLSFIWHRRSQTHDL
jgi:hypothetical protein